MTCGINHGLCRAGMSVWSWISGFRILIMANTAPTTVEKDKIHGYLQRIYVSSPDTLMKKVYHNLVSPMVRKGGRCTYIQNPAINTAKTSIPKLVNRMARRRRSLENNATAAPHPHNTMDAKANHLKLYHVNMIYTQFYHIRLMSARCFRKLFVLFPGPGKEQQ